MSSRLIVVVGSGPGIGSTTAAHFASEGFNVALISRNASRLNQDAERVSKAAGSAKPKINTYPVDVGNHDALKSALDKLQTEMGPPEVVLFNAARIATSEFGKIPAERLSEDFQVMNVGLYVTAAWALPLLESVKQQNPNSHPSFFMTGGGIWQMYDHNVFALSMQKAAQVNFAGCLAQIAGPKGVHVATISVNGVVEDNNPVINSKNVASTYWKLYQQNRDGWESLVDVGDLQALKN